MTKANDSLDRKYLVVAAGTVLKRIESRATELDPAITTADLERYLCIKPRSDTSRRGATFEKYRDGRWEGVYRTLVQKVRIAAAKNWLTYDELQELGVLELPVDPRHEKKDVLERHRLALEKFSRCLGNMRAGLLPYAMRGPNGRSLRAPTSKLEFAEEYRKWIADIEALGAEVRYLPYFRPPTKKDRSLASFNDLELDPKNWAFSLECWEENFRNSLARDEFFARYEGFDERDYESWEEYEAAVSEAEEERMQTWVFDPAKELPRDLYLWIGGREYVHGSPHCLLCDDEISPTLKLGKTWEEIDAEYEAEQEAYEARSKKFTAELSEWALFRSASDA